MCEFVTQMRIAKRSEVTIQKRLELLRRLASFLDGGPLLEATHSQLVAFQATYAHLAPASVNIYTRHVRAFYSWAHEAGQLDHDPSARLTVPHVRKGRPHPTRQEDLRVIFTCTVRPLRTAYILAAFAGLRCGEITRLEGQAVDLDGPSPSALVQGKGGKERTVPLLAPVVAELRGLPRRGWLVTLPNGRPYSPNRLSVDSHNQLAGLGVETTLHSMRGYFATEAARITRDPLLIRDLLGHESVATTEIYMQTSMSDVYGRLTELAGQAVDMLRPRHLKAVQ